MPSGFKLSSDASHVSLPTPSYTTSAPPPALDPLVLSQKGSLFLTRPTLATYTAHRDELLRAAKALFHVVRHGIVKADVSRTYALKEAAQAHRDLEARKTTGSTLLLP